MPKIVSAATDRFYMRRCFELARQGVRAAAPNPSVGAVIVYDGRTLGEGFTSAYGGAHAEVNAVNAVAEADKHLLSAATLYVSLEPCHHFGKTPPCVDLVLRCGFRRVVIAHTDPNPLVAGKSVLKLRAAKVQVHTGLLKKESRRINRPFFCCFEKKRPYIILKWAETRDQFIGRRGEQVWLTSPESKALVHHWRSETDAIMVGANTVLTDNPALTTRLVAGRSPLRISFFRALPDAKTIKKWQLYDKNAKTVVFTLAAKTTEMAALEHDYFTLICLENIESDADILNYILAYLHQIKVQTLMVEGGTNLLNLFMQNNLWDETRQFIVEKTLGEGVAAPNDYMLTAISERLLVYTEDVGGDLLLYIIKD